MRSLETEIKLVLNERCPGQRSAQLSADLEKAQFNSALSEAHVTQLSSVLDKAQHN